MKIRNLLAVTVMFLWIAGKALAEPQMVSLQKGDKRLDLFGTIHVAKPSFYPLPDEILQALKQADIVALELDMTNAEVMQSVMKSMTTIGMDENQDLSQILDAEGLERFNQLVGPVAVAMQKLKPGLLAPTLQLIAAKELGFTADAVDLYIGNYAKSHHVELVGLESPEEQMAALVSLSEEESIKFLKEVLSEKGADDIQNIEKLWVHGDAEIARQVLQEMKMELPQFYQVVVLDRNKVMAERIVALNQDNQRLFVGVGLGHLYGEKNVIELLEAIGYTKLNTDVAK